jgi:hypothetical protein
MRPSRKRHPDTWTKARSLTHEPWATAPRLTKNNSRPDTSYRCAFMSSAYKKVELAANVAIVVVALTLTTVVVKRYVWSSTPNSKQNNPLQIKVGDKLAVSNVDWRTSDSNLVLVLQKGCRYCNESAAFYQRLTKGLQGRSDVRILAVLPQGESESREYLSTLGVNVGNVVQAPPRSFGIGGTPAVMLVNEAGEIQGIWMGKLSSDQETQITERLRISPEAAAL